MAMLVEAMRRCSQESSCWFGRYLGSQVTGVDDDEHEPLLGGWLRLRRRTARSVECIQRNRWRE